MVLALPLVLAGCARPHSIPMRSVEALPPPPPPAAAPAREEASPELVKRAQRLLAELGYRPGPVDGVEGERTESAVRAFQDEKGLDVDGRVSEDLVDILVHAGQLYRTEQVQRRLAALGYDPGAVDGKIGRQTRRAIKAFEKDAGVEPQGKITPELFEQIAKAEARKVEWASEAGTASLASDSGPAPSASDEAAAESQPAQPDTSALEQVAPAAGVAGAETGVVAAPPPEETAVPSVPPAKPVPPSSETITTEENGDADRVIRPGDTVRLRIGRDKIETLDFTVGLDGTILLPDGVSIQAEGLTFKELEDLVMVKLVEVYLMGLEVDVMPQGELGQVKAAEPADGADASTDPSATN